MSDAISSKPMKVGGTAVPASAKDSRPKRGQGLAAMVTRPIVAVPLIILSLALLSWSGVTYLSARTLVVNARPRITPDTNVAVTAEQVAELERQARSAAGRLIHERSAITRALSGFEQQAHASGFQIEVSLKPAVTNAAGFKELTVYPAVVTLEPENDRVGSAFSRLVAWLREPSQIGAKIEIAGLTVRSKGDRLGSAQLELNFWTVEEHDKPAAK